MRTKKMHKVSLWKGRILWKEFQELHPGLRDLVRPDQCCALVFSFEDVYYALQDNYKTQQTFEQSLNYVVTGEKPAFDCCSAANTLRAFAAFEAEDYAIRKKHLSRRRIFPMHVKDARQVGQFLKDKIAGVQLTLDHLRAVNQQYQAHMDWVPPVLPQRSIRKSVHWAEGSLLPAVLAKEQDQELVKPVSCHPGCVVA